MIQRLVMGLTAFLLAAAVGSQTALAASSSAPGPQTLSPGAQDVPFLSLPVQAVDPVMAAMLWRTAHQPELLNPDYLSFFIGHPDNGINQTSNTSRAYYWHDHLRRLKYELYQEHDGSGRVTQAVMVAHMPNSVLNLESLHDVLGPSGKIFYDHKSHLTELYSFAPGTSLSFHSPQNSFAVQSSTVTYMGPPLPAPSIQDMASAHDHMISRGWTNGKPDWQALLPWLRRRVAHNPTDADAHLALADALLGTGQLHESINETRTALKYSRTDATTQQCLANLRRMKVLPAEQENTGLAAGTRTSQQVATGTNTSSQ